MISLEEIRDILRNDDPVYVEQLAQKAQQVTVQYFGRAVGLYMPLYLANYCDNYCRYCGFQNQYKIARRKLNADEIHIEMKEIARTGMQQILLLTGESRKHTPVEYIEEAVQIAKEYFSGIYLEVYPMEVDEYQRLFHAGVDGVTIYQETYDRDRYKYLHVKGKKADYEYRYATPERIAKAGIRFINMGALLGLSDVAGDVHALFSHVDWMERNYPGVEYAISFPRIIPLDDSPLEYSEVTDLTLIKLICLARVLFPRVGINLSTRETALIRDHALMMGVTKISAASKTNVGGYALNEKEDNQFDIQDSRSVVEIVKMLKDNQRDPVFTDWRRINNVLAGQADL